jgi:putative transposase
MILTFKIKLNLTEEQKDIISLMSKESAVLYNYFLNQLQEQYKKDKTYISFYTQQKELKNYKTEYLTFDLKKEILNLLHNNYKSFFSLSKKNKNLNPQPPKFRNTNYFFTLSFIQDFIIKNDKLILSYLNRKKIEINLNYIKPIKNLTCKRFKTKESNIKQLKIHKKNNEYFASIVYEKQEEIKKDTTNVLSIDLGKKNLLTVYDVKNNTGIIFNSFYLNKSQKFYDKQIDKLKSLKSKKEKNSKKYKQISNRILKIRSKKKTQNNLILHKISKDLSNQNKTIVVGELDDLKNNIKTNIKSINRQMQNNWNLQTFIHLLEYKTKLKGNQVIKVDEAWTSKKCCKCNSINHNLTLKDRQYICKCGLNLNRDINVSNRRSKPNSTRWSSLYTRLWK